MFDLAHLGDQIGQLDQARMRVAAGADDMDVLGARGQRGDNFFGVEHAVADDVIDLIQDDQVVSSALNLREAELPGLLAQAHVFGIGLRAADFHKAASHGPNLDLVVAQEFGCVKLAVMPGAFNELHHEHAQALTHGAKGGAEGTRGLPFSRAGVDDEEAFAFGHGFPGGRVAHGAQAGGLC
jgi:hypothetical protein